MLLAMHDATQWTQQTGIYAKPMPQMLLPMRAKLAEHQIYLWNY